MLPAEVGLAGASRTRRQAPSHSIMYRTLKNLGISKRHCARRPELNKRHARGRRQYECTWRHFNFARRCVKFSDECSIHRNNVGDSEWCFRFPTEKYDRNMITETSASRGLAQMIWGSIWLDDRGHPRRSPLIIMERDTEAPRHGYSADSYVEALREGRLPNYRPGQIFMQDNAGIHRARKVRNFLVSHGIWTMDWPAYSPDLSPIEHIWRLPKKYVLKLHPELRSMGESAAAEQAFIDALHEAWWAIPNRHIKSLILSMPRRLRAVRRAHGWQTSY